MILAVTLCLVPSNIRDCGNGQERVVIESVINPTNSGASCSKLTMSLVNHLLKFQTAILQIHCYFLLKKNVRILCIAKDSHILSTKNNSVFAYVVRIYLTS